MAPRTHARPRWFGCAPTSSESSIRSTKPTRDLSTALPVAEKALGPRHPQVASTLVSRAGVEIARDRPGTAEPLYRRSLSIYEQAMHDQHLGHRRRFFSALGSLYAGTGRYDDALPMLQRAASIYETVYGEIHERVATATSAVADVLTAAGKSKEAEEQHQRALAIREGVFDATHPAVAGDLGRLAALYVTEGRFADAESIYQRTLSIYENVYGPDDPNVALNLRNLAALYFVQGRYDEAKPLLDRASAIPGADKTQ